MTEISDDKQRLLIVDDSKVIRVTARKILRNHFETVEAVDGNNAWEILTTQEPFSLIVSDLTMPNLDGFGLLEKIRSSHLPHVRNIPVIIITGANDSEATMKRATEAGATDFIGKPFDSVHLLARTQAHAGSYAANNALIEENLSLEDQAMVDPLTGLANDTAFMEQGCQQLAYSIRHRTGLAFASLEIDEFDGLVREHDTDAVELVIKSVGSALAANIRKEDVAARIGTARFALLLPGMDAVGVSRLSERIAGDIGKQAVISAGRQVRFTVSIGIATPEIRPDTRFDDLLRAADDSLKLAVARGGGRIMPGGSHPDEASTEQTPELALEPLEKATFGVAEVEETLPDIECEPVEALNVLPDLIVETATDAETVMTDSKAETDLTESAQAAHYEAPATADEAEIEIEETIVITSPYNLYDLDELETPETATGSDATAPMDSEAGPVAASAPDVTEPAAVNPVDSVPLDDGIDAKEDEKRPGTFRRLLRALFGRRV